ncbi:hypothetical protein PC129_g21325 [Phytophthora cactorum]|nr:hypothetical protein Pcac1_g17936 [Phytophthora cactorum]KAG2841519.1 hypothetical protein PC112_g3376 [Phytophthora cactorum]KAG2842432.1 hypothetical protein PC111_g2768 [Phytophthora cactorum]KAG2865601.1 hypothetical protein PC113_g3595 [Phytophthora cactorum]KAG2925396.1 hypothetical protein PC114_g4164 [Phytophthora cactorum]
MLRKTNLSIGSGDIFFVRLIRMKTSEEQGLSLMPDEDFATCPLLTIALALVSQASPTMSLLSQLPEQQLAPQVALTPGTPLIDLIDHPVAMTAQQAKPERSESEKTVDGAPGIHIYVNRVLDRVAKSSGVSESLTSHLFRHGGAQHANGAGMCV